MVKLEFGMVKDKFWLYYAEGEQEPNIVTVTKINHNTVTLSNGEEIAADSFYERCEPAIADEDMVSEETEAMDELNQLIDDGSGGEQLDKSGHSGDPIDEMMKGIQFDQKTGVPLLPGGKAPSLQPVAKANAVTTSPRQTFDSPLIALIEKGQLKTTKISFQLEAPTVNKTIFNALIETYPEEEIEVLLDYLVTKIGLDNIREAIKAKLRQHYKSSKKNVES